MQASPLVGRHTFSALHGACRQVVSSVLNQQPEWIVSCDEAKCVSTDELAAIPGNFRRESPDFCCACFHIALDVSASNQICLP